MIDRRFAEARVARLATVGADGAPHLVPVVFAVVGSVIYTAVDGKPKRHRSLRRLDDIAGEPRVSVLADHYDEDWSLLWWVRADGVASVSRELPAAVAALRAKYPQYAEVSLEGPFISIEVREWSAWSSSSAPGG